MLRMSYLRTKEKENTNATGTGTGGAPALYEHVKLSISNQEREKPPLPDSRAGSRRSAKIQDNSRTPKKRVSDIKIYTIQGDMDCVHLKTFQDLGSNSAIRVPD
ncbi:hypothetical protein WAI453_004878 [Rhynchosporium graminicola]